jgi:hypothetical protein
MNLSKLGGLGDMVNQMKDAYSSGTDAMNQSGKVVAEDMNPDHEIELDIKLSAKVDGHEYLVDAHIIFEIELNPILSSEAGSSEELSSLLDNLDIDLGDDKAAVMEQLSNKRGVGVVKDIKVNKLIVSNGDGKIDAELNKDGAVLATIMDKDIALNCESVFSFPGNTDALVAIPSMEKMQKNMRCSLKNIGKKVEFSWTEEGKDNLKVKGSFQIKEL